MLSVQQIKLSFQSTILDGVSFDVKEGEVFGLAGHSGAGKTSLLKVIAGLIDVDEGQILLDGKPMVGPSMKMIPGHSEIQLVNQDFNLDFYQTTEENLRNKMVHLPRNIQNQFIDELLDLVELTPMKEQQVQTLSGGEQQRVAIARALAMEPKVLLLDEPFAHLDTELRIRLISYLLKLKEKRNMCVVIVTHNSEELINLTDRIAYLKDGEIKRIATPFDFYYRYKTVKEGRMFGIVNQVTINEKSIHFRPDEYIVDEQNPQLNVEYQRSIFMGGYFLNEFNTSTNKIILLLHLNKMTDVKGISIRKKERT
ncbi:MAG: ABC transporter ATP-binding protein [Crocinitomicaceae bacterium]|nr:ABC transporter ATP-binding protein [Crocinitomicaceae bacterium]